MQVTDVSRTMKSKTIITNKSNMLNKRFLKFSYAAIRRYGEKRWTAAKGVIEFNPNYTVGVSTFVKGGFDTGDDTPYIVELSNGTRFLCFMHNYGKGAEEEILSEHGEVANSYASERCYEIVRRNTSLAKLNNYENGK